MPGLVVFTKALQIVASIGVAKVVTTVVDNAVKSAGVGTFTRVAHWTGSLVIGSMAVEQATKHVGRIVHTTAEELEEAKKKAEEKAKETEEK
jgi:hypothetical protein